MIVVVFLTQNHQKMCIQCDSLKAVHQVKNKTNQNWQPPKMYVFIGKQYPV